MDIRTSPVSPASHQSGLARWWPLGASLILGLGLAVLVPVITIVGGLVMGVVCAVIAIRSNIGWSLRLFASGYLLGLLGYVGLAVLGVLTGDPSSGQSTAG